MERQALDTRNLLLNLLELMNSQHQKSAESVQGHEHTLLSITGCVIQATSKRGWQPYAHEGYSSICILGEAKDLLRDLNTYPEANSTSESAAGVVFLATAPTG